MKARAEKYARRDTSIVALEPHVRMLLHCRRIVYDRTVQGLKGDHDGVGEAKYTNTSLGEDGLTPHPHGRDERLAIPDGVDLKGVPVAKQSLV